MKPKYLQLLAAILLSFTATIFASAQNGLDYITISGEVRDAETKKVLEYVSVSVANTNITTVTNSDGVFSVKIKKSLEAKTVVFSHVGYANQQLSINGSDMSKVKVVLEPTAYTLDGTVVGTDALALVKEAISRIPENYSPNANLLTGFYRETTKKRSSYINISEAIAFTYKTAYSKKSDDRVQVYKGRQLVSPKVSDTLMVKLQGGPIAAVYMDAVKEWDLFTDPENLSYYKFTLLSSVMIDGRAHRVVNFRPQVVVPYALLYGTLYIDEQTLAFTKIEASLSMDDENKATEAMLRKKPFGIRFKPEGLSYEVVYKRQGDICYLNYVQSELRFKCDWKKKLFSSNYLIVAEMVVTDVASQNVSKIPAKEAFNEKYSLSDKVSSFYDPNFWEDYNIIEPTESLESAVSKLKKKIE